MGAVTPKKRAQRRPKHPTGRGLVNKLIDLLPFEAHLPGGYRYCGPGTKLKERLARGDPGINGLDEACKLHDIEYSKTSDTAERNKADIDLANRAWARVKAGDSSLAERAAAWAVTNAMKLKAKMGAGCCGRQRRSKTKRVKTGAGAKRATRGVKRTTMGAGAKRRRRSTKKRTVARVNRIPTSGGNVRSILSRIGVAAKPADRAVKKIRAVMSQRKKNVKLGQGLYLRPYKTGYGLYLAPYKHLN